MTTYATTYGWRSAGVGRGLMTSPPEQNPVNGGRRVPTRVHGTADPITTNQKVAGSSPAERATKTLQIAGFYFESTKRYLLVADNLLKKPKKSKEVLIVVVSV